MISKLQLKAFYESHKDECYKRRNSGDTSQWDESYKWELFPKLNKELGAYTDIDIDATLEIIKKLQRSNPNSGSLTHWTELDNFTKISQAKPSIAYKLMKLILASSPDTVDDDIEDADLVASTFFGKKFGPATYGYILSALDCGSFAPFHSDLLKGLVELGVDDEPKIKGEKYKLLNDSSLYLGELMQADKLTTNLEQTALNGQDFMWATYND